MTELQIRTAIVNKIKANAPTAKVWPRWRRPFGYDAEGNLRAARPEDILELYGNADGKIDVYMVRRVRRRTAELNEFNQPSRTEQVYSIVGHKSLIDNEDDGLASEAVFQAEIEAIAAAFAADLQLGFDASVHHRGFDLVADFSDQLLAEILVHSAECWLVVDIEEC